jgi:hypothetical protein
MLRHNNSALAVLQQVALGAAQQNVWFWLMPVAAVSPMLFTLP